MTFCTDLVVGGALNRRATNALGQTDEEKTPTADSRQTAKSQTALFADPRVKRWQLKVENTKEQVMLCGKGNSDAAEPAAEDITKEFEVIKTVKNNPEVVAPPTREVVKDSQDSTKYDVKGGIPNFRGLLTVR